MYRHDALDVFASGNDKEPHFWNSLIRQMLLGDAEVRSYELFLISRSVLDISEQLQRWFAARAATRCSLRSPIRLLRAATMIDIIIINIIIVDDF